MDRLNFIVWTSGGILAGVAGKRHCHPNMAPQIIAQALLVSCRTGFSGAFRMLSISFNFCSARSQRPSATKSQTAPMSVLGHSRPTHSAPVPANVRYASNSDLSVAVSYTHLRAHETRHDLVCRLLLEKKKK